MQLEALIVRAVAPAHLADAIVGDLCERQAALALTLGEARALAVCRGEVLRSLPPLATYRAAQALSDDWMVALPVAVIICGLCVATIPLWDHLGMGGGVYHVLRLFVIGLVLGCVPRTSSLSFAFLLLLIGISDATIDANELGVGWHVLAGSNLYRRLAIDAASMAAALAPLRVVTSFRRPNAAAGDSRL